jgi:hypothetical protein
MSFAQDGNLFISFGDGGSGGDPELNGQDMKVFHGKIVRINVTRDTVHNRPYTIPSDNPFFGVSGVKQEIFAYGLRNPWRCSFDRYRPTYFICADVGQDIMEEVDLIKKGGNYGWNRYEGTLDYNINTTATNAIPPVMEYDHTIGHSITGGYVYRGTRDACHCGKYIFADYQDTVYFTGTENPPDSGMYTKQAITVKCSSENPRCAFPGNIYSFGEDDDGEVYILGGTGMYRTTNPAQCGSPCNCSCVVDGKCLKTGDVNPDNECQRCDPDYPCQWTLASTCPSTTSTSTSGTVTSGSSATHGGLTTTGHVEASTTGEIVQNDEPSSAEKVITLWTLVTAAALVLC